MDKTFNQHKNLQERAALLALLRSALWNKRPGSLAAFPLSDAGWRGVFRLSRQQTVMGLAFQGLRHLPDDMLPPEPLLLQWVAEADAIERRNKRMNAALESLCLFFRDNGINPVLQKGQGTARFYASPLLRECGDIDLFFADSCAWQSALGCLRSKGIVPKKQGDGSVFYRWNGVDVEHHRRLLDLYNPFQQSFVRSLERQKGFQRVVLATASGTTVAVPSAFLELLLHNLHILKHTLGRGIGLRQLCDMALACHHLHGEVDPHEMKAVCRSLGLSRWTPLLHAFLVQQLGLPSGSLPYCETSLSSQPLADIVWRGGNFGQYNERLKQHSGQWQRKRLTAISFAANARFAFHHAPSEAAWFFLQLMKGQIQ